MKNSTLWIALLAFLLTTQTLFAQTLKVPAASPLQTVKQAFGLGDITVEYYRPGARDRVVFGDVVPLDKIWRTGANGSTKITFSDDVIVDGKALKAGTYALYSIPGKSTWDILFYSDLNLGGNVNEYDKSKEVLRLNVKSMTLQDKVETFTIDFNTISQTSINMDIAWDKTKVRVPIKTEIDSKMMKNIESALARDTRPYYQAASYYYDNNKDLTKALEWVSIATDQNPKAYWIWLLKAKIQSKANNKKGAVEAAQKALELATADQDDAYIKQSQKIINDNK